MAFLLHGSLDAPSTWSGVRAALPGWVIETPDSPDADLDGPGIEGGPGQPSPLPRRDALAIDLPRILEMLHAAAAPILLGGHSYGGLLALRAALAAPSQVAGLLLIEPIAFGLLSGPLRRDFDVLNLEIGAALGSERNESSLRLLVDYWNGRGAWDLMPERVRERLRAQAGRASIEVESGRQDRTTPQELSGYAGPVRVLWGSETTAESKAVCAALCAAWPHAVGLELPGVGHQVARAAPEAVAAALRALAEDADAG